MKRSRRDWLAQGLSLAVAGALPACANLAQSLPDDTARLTEELQDLLAQYPATAHQGHALRIVKGRETVFEHFHGDVRLGSGMPIDAHSIFEVASLSKMVTALAIMQLDERGLLRMDQPLGLTTSDWPPAWADITIHQLLTHQSGIVDVINRWPRRSLHQLDIHALKGLLRDDERLVFPAGTQAQYINTNYMVLADIVAQVSDQSFEDYLAEHIFLPAQMRSSSVRQLAPNLQDDVVRGYGTDLRIHGIDYQLTGAIGQKSSLQDVHHFLDALTSGQLVSARHLQRMMTPHVRFSDGQYYGYGLYIGRLGGLWGRAQDVPGRGAGHTGRLGPFRSACYFNIQTKFGFIMLCNGGQEAEQLMMKLMDKARRFQDL
jgi:CubicO group peptidase (beta-lactamase class C family)